MKHENNSNEAISNNDNLPKGIFILMGFCLFAPLMDGFAKQLAYTIPVVQIVWARFFFHMLIALPIATIKYKKIILQPKYIKIQILRSIFLMLGTLCYFTAIKYMPIANALALTFITPFVVTALSGIMLGEKIGIHRWSAVIIGFIGILIILQPNSEVISPYAILPLTAGVIYAFYVMLTRKIANATPPIITLAYTSLTGAILMSAWLAISGEWVIPESPQIWFFLIMVGVCTTLSHFCMIKAFDFAPASSLSPFLYCEIATAAIVSLLWFNEFPTITTWIGIIIICTGGTYISWREHHWAKKGKLPFTINKFKIRR